MESRVRSIAKTFSWRFFATLITMFIAWIITGKPESGFAIGLADTFIKLFAFYVHERAWNRLSLKKMAQQMNFFNREDSNGTRTVGSGPVMLVLFSDKKADKAIALAFKKAEKSKTLILVYVIDDNLAPYFVGTDAGLYPALKEICERDLLEKYWQEAVAKMDQLAQSAKTLGIQVRKHILTKSDYQKDSDLFRAEKPALIISGESRKGFGLKSLMRQPEIQTFKNTGIPVINI